MRLLSRIVRRDTHTRFNKLLHFNFAYVRYVLEEDNIEVDGDGMNGFLKSILRMNIVRTLTLKLLLIVLSFQHV